MSMTVEERELEHGFSVRISYDEDASHLNPFDPDSQTQVGMFVGFHSRYHIGTPDHGYREQDYTGWDDLRSTLVEEHKPKVILPVYLYEHSGVMYSVGEEGNPFSCPWDSGMVGFVFDTAEGREETGIPDEEIKAALTVWVEEYSAWANGEVYGYEVIAPDGEIVDGCWGFVGEADYAMQEGVAAAAYHIKEHTERAAAHALKLAKRINALDRAQRLLDRQAEEDNWPQQRDAAAALRELCDELNQELRGEPFYPSTATQ